MILGTGKPVSHEIRLATWRYVDDSRRMTAICLDPKGDRKSMLDPSPAVIRKEMLWL